jgi:hypothetical protein
MELVSVEKETSLATLRYMDVTDEKKPPSAQSAILSAFWLVGVFLYN